MHISVIVMRSSLSALPASLLLLVAAATAPLALAQDPASESGLKIEHTKPISCSRPSRKGDKIAVNYIGTLESTGVEFDQSYKRGVPFEFRLGAGQVIAGWDLGLLAMCPGEKRKLTIPPELGYGERNMGIIPPHSTLVFETELVEIVGVQQGTLEKISSPIVAISSAVDEGAFSIATAPATPPTTTESDDKDGLAATPLEPETAGNLSPQQEEEQPECQLLGPFALFVQAALGAVAISSLVVKRYRETPKRPWKIFTFDVSKQVLGSMLTHVLNLAMSMFSTVDLIAAVATAASQAKADDGRVPNPCSYYLLNLGIDVSNLSLVISVALTNVLEDHHRYSSPISTTQSTAPSLPSYSPGIAPTIHQVRSLRHTTTYTLVAQATAHLLSRPRWDEIVRLLPLRRHALAPMDRRLGTTLDRR